MDSRTTTTLHAVIDCAPAAAATPGRSLRRRGLIAGAAALVATAIAAQPIAATGPLVGTNSMWSGASDANLDGVQGYTTGASNAGLFGRNNTLNGVGVAGAAPSGIGVAGSSGNGPGVSGVSTGGPGSVGVSSTGYGVSGVSTSGPGSMGVSSTSYGVLGISTATGGIGLVAYSTVSGTAAAFSGPVTVNGTHSVSPAAGGGHGVVSYTSTSGYYAMVGQGLSAGTHGLYASSGAGGTAGVFSGNVVVYGNFAVTGSKNAAVPHPDGSHRLVYSSEAPEPWFEDFGTATLTAGKASVTLDPDFAAVAVTSGYHVFLTPYGDCGGLIVTNRTATGFTVQEGKGGTSTLSFSWRVAARRKDIAGNRFAPFTLPVSGAVPAPPAALALSPDLPVPGAPLPVPAPTPLNPPAPVAPVLTAPPATVTPMTSGTVVPAISAPMSVVPITPAVPTGAISGTATAGSTATATGGSASTSAGTAAIKPAVSNGATGTPAITPTGRPVGATATGGTAPNAAPVRR